VYRYGICFQELTDLSPRDSIIKLVVPRYSGETETLNVHQGVLCKHAGFFRRMMKPEWTRMRDSPNIIELPDETVNTVSDYVKWLYAGVMPLKLYDADDMDDKDKRGQVAEEAEKIFVMLAEAYVFGEKIIDVRYKNAVVRAVAAAKNSSKWNMGPESVRIVYDGTPPGSPLRRMIAESLARLAHDDAKKGVGWMSFIDGYSKEALADALKATIRFRCKVNDDALKAANLLDSYLEEE
jgi:hypothetical protein